MKQKENLIQQIEMKFDEAVELFNEETLASMSMAKIVGGTDTYCGDNEYCCGAQCIKGCQNHCKGCSTTPTSTTPKTP